MSAGAVPSAVRRVAGRVLLCDPRTLTIALVLVNNRNASRGCVWTAVGGGTIGQEAPRDAAVRELREELGLHCSAGDLSFLLACTSDFLFNGSLVHQTDFIYQTRFDARAQPKLRTHSDELLNVTWFTRDDLLGLTAEELVPDALRQALRSDSSPVWHG